MEQDASEGRYFTDREYGERPPNNEAEWPR